MTRPIRVSVTTTSGTKKIIGRERQVFIAKKLDTLFPGWQQLPYERLQTLISAISEGLDEIEAGKRVLQGQTPERIDDEIGVDQAILSGFFDEDKTTKKARLDKRQQSILDAAVQIQTVSTMDDKALGFLGRAFVMATLPHKRVQGMEFIRQNGNYTLSISAPSKTGIPYGVIPRLILIWISEEVVKKKSRELILGDSLSAWMAELGMVPTGGRWGSITRLKQQMKALLASSITATWEGKGAWAMDNVRVADRAILWWDPKNPNQTSLWESRLVLSEQLFNELLEHSVPFDKRVLRELKRSPLALDIYVWLTYRMHTLQRPQAIRWSSLMRQFGSSYEESQMGIRHFKAEFKKQLKNVLSLYRDCHVEPTTDDLVLYPSPTSVRELE